MRSGFLIAALPFVGIPGGIADDRGSLWRTYA